MGLQIRLRDYLLDKFPIVIRKGHIKDYSIDVSLDLKNMSYTTKVWYEDTLVAINSSRFDFSNYYYVSYDKEGNRIYSISHDGTKIEINHMDVYILMDNNKSNLTILRK